MAAQKPVKKAPAKSPVVKAPAKSPVVKKAPAKPAVAKKTVAKKAPAKKVASAPLITNSLPGPSAVSDRARALIESMAADDAARQQRSINAEERRAGDVTLLEGKPTKRGLRYEGDSWVGTIVAVVLLISGTSAFVNAGDAVGIAASVLYSLVLLVIAYRSYTAAVYTGEIGIEARNTFRNRIIPWDQIRGYSISRGYRGSRILVLRVAGASEMKLGAFRASGQPHHVVNEMRAAAATLEVQRREHLGPDASAVSFNGVNPEDPAMIAVL